MSAKILAVTNQKGGSGKSTVTMTLAAEFAGRGLRVLIVDADAQGTASQWSAAAPDDSPYPAAVVSLAQAGAKLHRELRAHVENYDLIFVDCPPSVEASTPQSALLVADLALVPVQPSPADIWATRGILRLVENAQAVNEGLRAYLLPNMVQGTAISTAVLKELEALGVPVLSSHLGLRAAYKEAALLGRPLAALGRSAKVATAEVAALADEIEIILGVN